jgi:hypothetical protein
MLYLQAIGSGIEVREGEKAALISDRGTLKVGVGFSETDGNSRHDTMSLIRNGTKDGAF